MEAAAGSPPLPPPKTDPLTENIKRRLLKKGVEPTPKIIHTLRKKHRQKSLRKSKRLQASQPEPLSESQEQTLAEEFYFQTVSREYKRLNKILVSERANPGGKMVGRPWERLERGKLRELAPGSDEYRGENLKSEHLRELGEIFEERKKEAYSLILDDDDVELGDETVAGSSYRHEKRLRPENETVQILVDRLCSGRGITIKDWKFSRIMKQSSLEFTEVQMLKVVGKLGDRGRWKQAMSVVEWVYSRKERKYYKSRFVYTKLLAVLGKARRPQEALQVFQLMLGDRNIYPDMAAYHSISVTLGQAGLMRELMNIVERMKQKPTRVKNSHSRNWDPVLQPDVVVYNAVLNACVPSHQWKGVSWVFQQLRKSGLRPNGATFGLAMEVMLHAGKYELVHELFQKMQRAGEVPNALTYKVLVKTFSKEDKIDKAIDVIRDMEQRGIVRTASVYYELACCLCNKGRWQEAVIEVQKLKKLPQSKPLSFAYTGMILASMDAGHINDCISIFEHMARHCNPNIGAINAMIEVYGRNDMFSEAKALFETTERLGAGSGNSSNHTGSHLVPDFYTYTAMLKASASAQHWEYFEHIYKEMILQDYQLDQSKHAPLLVKASRAGKGHLLEHAFDASLEAGGIPHSSLFTEMVCQALEVGEHGRAAVIINTMAHAPFQVSEKDWTDLLEKNRDRFSEDCLLTLSDELRNKDMVEEAAVSNVLRSLETLSKPASAEEHEAASSVHSHQSMSFSNTSSENLSSATDVQHGCNGFASSTVQDGRRHPWGEELAFDSKALYSDVVSDDYDDFSDDEEHDSGLEGSDLPSAEEILKEWKESRQRDGFVSPFGIS